MLIGYFRRAATTDVDAEPPTCSICLTRVILTRSILFPFLYVVIGSTC
jgi:hypothetical protein